ncbi:hypothetical protein ACSAZL_00900 [Methanosarcina sp. T3]|uniref:hypothetical protein n=1 Tax=Methanosarcina sp. T3 TaxID=3439062 RepID=UPI003F839A3C
MTEGMKSQIGDNNKKRKQDLVNEGDRPKGLKSKSYYLDVIFIQLLLLLLLYGVAKFVVPMLS